MTNPADTSDAVVIERILDAPRETVWRMWTDAHEFASWYGPSGATVPVAELDVRVGGRRRVCLAITTPQGPARMWFGGEHLRVEEPSLLVYTEQTTDEAGAPTVDGQLTRVRVELFDVDGGTTRMVVTHSGIPADSPGAAGWRAAFDKLARHLAR